jgi:dephospho-CoA kinase
MAAAGPPTATATGPEQRVWRVGLTGGIASGKTTVSKLFAALGVPIIDADEVARDVVAPGAPLLARIGEQFGTELIAPDGTLDRRALRDRVFAAPPLRLELEALLHPAIRAEMEARSRSAGGRYQIFAIPLLAERGRDARIDRVLVVDCSEELQRRRLRARDASTEAQVDAILGAQASRATRLAMADDVIHNEDGLGVVRDQVEKLHGIYIRLAAPS